MKLQPFGWCRWRSAGGASYAALLGLCSLLFACTGAADVPVTPDLTELQREFDAPTAVLDETSVADAVRQMPSLSRLSAGFRAAGFTTDGVNTAGDGSGAGTNLNVQGSIHVTVRCPGELDVPAFGDNGTVDMTLGVQKNLIKRGIGMLATHCVLRGQVGGVPARVEVSGPIYMDLGRDLGLRQRWSGRLLMWVRGTIDVDGITLENLAARWTEDQFEYLYRLPDETWVIAVVTEEGKFSLHDQQVIWGCSDGQECALEQ